MVADPPRIVGSLPHLHVPAAHQGSYEPRERCPTHTSDHLPQVPFEITTNCTQIGHTYHLIEEPRTKRGRSSLPAALAKGPVDRVNERVNRYADLALGQFLEGFLDQSLEVRPLVLNRPTHRPDEVGPPSVLDKQRSQGSQMIEFCSAQFGSIRRPW